MNTGDSIDFAQEKSRQLLASTISIFDTRNTLTKKLNKLIEQHRAELEKVETHSINALLLSSYAKPQQEILNCKNEIQSCTYYAIIRFCGIFENVLDRFIINFWSDIQSNAKIKQRGKIISRDSFLKKPIPKKWEAILPIVEYKDALIDNKYGRGYSHYFFAFLQIRNDIVHNDGICRRKTIDRFREFDSLFEHNFASDKKIELNEITTLAFIQCGLCTIFLLIFNFLMKSKNSLQICQSFLLLEQSYWSLFIKDHLTLYLLFGTPNNLSKNQDELDSTYLVLLMKYLLSLDLDDKETSGFYYNLLADAPQKIQFLLETTRSTSSQRDKMLRANPELIKDLPLEFLAIAPRFSYLFAENSFRRAAIINYGQEKWDRIVTRKLG